MQRQPPIYCRMQASLFAFALPASQSSCWYGQASTSFSNTEASGKAEYLTWVTHLGDSTLFLYSSKYDKLLALAASSRLSNAFTSSCFVARLFFNPGRYLQTWNTTCADVYTGKGLLVVTSLSLLMRFSTSSPKIQVLMYLRVLIPSSSSSVYRV